MHEVEQFEVVEGTPIIISVTGICNGVAKKYSSHSLYLELIPPTVYPAIPCESLGISLLEMLQ